MSLAVLHKLNGNQARELPVVLALNYNKTNSIEFLNNFHTIKLNEMNSVKMLDRFDTKYWFNAVQLTKILEEIKNDYYVLEIEGSRIHSYKTIYYDTPEDVMYLSHHNGKSERLKVRKREYVDSGICFLEIKLKNNKGKTRKKRLPVKSVSHEFTREEKCFIQQHTSLNLKELGAKFSNSFRRITMVNKNYNERCTIDTFLRFHSFYANECEISDLVIIELKQNVINSKSKLAETLKKNGIYQQGFSKYCIGRALNETSLKKNRFKPNILKIQKQFTIQ